MTLSDRHEADDDEEATTGRSRSRSCPRGDRGVSRSRRRRSRRCGGGSTKRSKKRHKSSGSVAKRRKRYPVRRKRRRRCFVWVAARK